jgi:hypothetical protein
MSCNCQCHCKKPLQVGDKLHGYCGGHFGRNSYGDKRVEGVGADWVVARDEKEEVVFFEGDPADLEQYRKPEPEYEFDDPDRV